MVLVHAAGSFVVSGDGHVSTYTEVIGRSGSVAFAQTGGTNTISSYLYLGYSGGSSSTYNLQGVGQLSAWDEYIGNSGTGIFTQSSGTNAVSDKLCLGASSGSSGTYNLNAGLLLTASLARGTGTAAFNLGGGTLRAVGSFATNVPMTAGSGSSSIDTNGFNITISGNLAASGSLTKEGLGMLALGGSLSMTDSSSLLVNSGSMTAMSIVGSDSTITVGVDDSRTATLAVNHIRAHKLVLEPGSRVILGSVSGAPVADFGGIVANSYGDDSIVSGMSAVPEPSTYVLLCTAGLACAFRRLRRFGRRGSWQFRCQRHPEPRRT